MRKATAIAHPIQGLIKYHGLKDAELRLPLHDSISVCTAPFETKTTLQIASSFTEDIIEIDGRAATPREAERALSVINYFREITRRSERVLMRSVNNFPSNIGLGASSSGFAALAVAADQAFNAKLTRHEISSAARLGAGSASRAVPGGYAHWYSGKNHHTSYAETIATEKQLPMGIVIAIIPTFKQTDDAHAEVMQSPFLPCRVAFAKAAIDDLRAAVIRGDFSTVGALAEQDSLALHATTMTGPNGLLHWQPETLMVLHEVRKMRSEGIECYFSIDTGATVYINSRPEDQERVQKRIEALGIETALATVGGGAQLTKDHLF